MAKFCKWCGTQIEDDFRFCDMCGKPLTPPGQEGSSAHAPVGDGASRQSWFGAKKLKIGGGALVVLCVVGLASYFVTRPASLPDNEALTTLLMTRPEFADLGCVDDFAYAKSPVWVAPYDQHTRDYLDYLVRSGVYSSAGLKSQKIGFFTRQHYEYTHAKGSEKFFRHDKLCAADGIHVSHVDYGARIDDYHFPVVRAHVVYELHNPAAWAVSAASGKVSQLFPLKAHGEIEVPLKYEGKHWSLMSSKESKDFDDSPAAHSYSGASLLGKLSNLFSNDPGKMIYGKWINEESFIPVMMTFTQTSFYINGQKQADNVKYAKEGDQIVITIEGINGDMRVKVLSSDSISVDIDHQKTVLLKRVK